MNQKTPLVVVFWTLLLAMCISGIAILHFIAHGGA
jgi:hypothetical protein